MFFDLQKLLNTLPSQPRSVKTFFGISLDFACTIFSVWLAYYLRLGDFVSLSERGLTALIFFPYILDRIVAEVPRTAILLF